MVKIETLTICLRCRTNTRDINLKGTLSSTTKTSQTQITIASGEIAKTMIARK